jgi:hypothetical protein
MGQHENMLALGYEELARGVGRGTLDSWGGPAIPIPVTTSETLAEAHAEAIERNDREVAANPLDEGSADHMRAKQDKPLRIEEEAHGLVFGDREAAYGHPSSDFTAMGRITAAILSRWLESEGYVVIKKIEHPLNDYPSAPVYMPDISPEVVALIMTAVKLSRQSAQPKRDNLVDLIGYTLCADRIIEGE